MDCDWKRLKFWTSRACAGEDDAMAATEEQRAGPATLEAVQDRVLWLATSIVQSRKSMTPAESVYVH